MLYFTFRKLRNAALLLCICCTLFSTAAIAQGTWTQIAAQPASSSGGVMLLLNDGTVICKNTAGGGNGTGWSRLTPVNGSYVNGTWSTIASMAKDRLYFSTQVLPDGRVYACGGEYGAGGNNGEVWNPATNTWTTAGGTGWAFAYNISDANSEILPDGTVLQAYVDEPNTDSNWYWHPATNTYTRAKNCVRWNNEAVWIKLPDSSIIFFDNYSTTSERFRFQTGLFTNDGTGTQNTFDPYGEEEGAGFLLPNGQAFFIGSTPVSQYYTPSGTAAAGVFSSGPALPSASGGPDAPAAMMPNGHIIMALSPTPTAANNFPSPTTFYEFDYTTNTFTTLGAPGGGASLANSTYIYTMLMLPDGSVMLSTQGSKKYYVYKPNVGPIAAGQPTISTITRENCDTFQITGTLFNGISEGAAYGDDWQMSTNYPIVRLTAGANTYYATTYNWNRIGAVMTGALPDTCIFKLPAGLPVGTYSVTVVANGNPSAPVLMSTSVTIMPGSVALCAGASTTLSDSSSIGTWSTSNTSIATIGGSTGVLTGVAGGTATVSYVINYNAGCYATIPATVNAAPSAINGNPSICLGATNSLTDAVTGGTWSSTVISVASVDGSGDVLGAGTGTSTISYTASTGCAATVIATVTALPGATITPLSSTTFCLGSSVTLDANTGAGFTYQWLLGGTAISGATSSSYTATTGGNYSVVVTNANGCSSTSAVTVVTTTSGPGATITPAGPTSFCAGGSVVLNANTGAGLTYQWQNGGTNIGGATTASYTATTSGDYTVVVSQGVCTVTSTGTVVTVVALPVVAAITGTDMVCTGLTTNLADDTTGGVWTSSNTGVATIGSSSGIVTGVLAGTTKITYTFTNICGSASANAIVTVNTSTAISPVNGNTAICIGGTAGFSDVTTLGAWSSTNTSVATISVSGVVSGISAGTTTISYTITNGAGCVNSSTAIVTVSAPFAATITPLSSTTFCTGGFVTLDATTGTGYTYQWQVGGVNISGATTSSYTASTGGNYTCIIASPSGCTVETGGTLVTVNSGTSIVASVNIEAALGDTVCNTTTASTFTAVPTNGGTTPTYQWFVNGTATGTGATYSYIPANGDVIKVILTSNAPCIFPDTASTSITMTVSPALTPSVSITSIHNDTTCTGDTVQFAAVPYYGGTAPTYLWTENGINVATGPYYIYAPSNNDTLVVTMTSNYPCLATPMAVSSLFIIHVLAPTTNTLLVSVSQSSIAAGSVDTFTAVTSGAGSSPTFQWYINGNPVAGATGAQYITDSLKDGQIVNCKETSSYICSEPGYIFSSGIIISVSSDVKQAGLNTGNFTLVPNPNNGTFTVHGSLPTMIDGRVSIAVTDVLGQSILRKDVVASNGTIDEQIILPAATPAGTYQVSVTSGGDHVVFHVVINK